MSVIFFDRNDPRYAGLAAAADRQDAILRRAADLDFPAGRAAPAYHDAILDQAGAFLDARAARLAPDPRLDATIAPEPPPPAGFVVTVTFGPDTVLSVGGENALFSRLPPSEQRGLVVALADALRLAAGTEPAQSVVGEATDLLDMLGDGLSPSDREEADAALATAVLARCQSLIDAAKARLAL